MATQMPSSLEIAQEAELRTITEIAEGAGLEPDEYDLYGKYKAKVSLDVLERLKDRPDGKLICVTAITPTKAGEGKTTTSVSLTQGLGSIGKKVALCLREASLGPVFGIKGGAAGGGYAQVVPMEDMNLHFTGDIHAIGTANNLLAAMLEASLLHGASLGTWAGALCGLVVYDFFHYWYHRAAHRFDRCCVGRSTRSIRAIAFSLLCACRAFVPYRNRSTNRCRCASSSCCRSYWSAWIASRSALSRRQCE